MPRKDKNSHVNGNSVASAAAFNRELARVGSMMLKWEQSLESLEDDELLVTGCTVKTPADGRAEYLLIVKATNGEGFFVCFCSGETLAAAVGNFVGRHQSGTLVWKVDEYAKPNR